VLLKRLLHRDKPRIALFFDYDVNLKSKVKSIPGALFSATHRCFYVDDSEENLRLILNSLRDYADVDISALTRKNIDTEGSHEPHEESVPVRLPVNTRPAENVEKKESPKPMQ